MEVKDKKYKKETIPKALKDAVWNIWIGETIGKTKCMCCELKEITQNSFDCGHVDAEANGGKLSPMNLRPVCSVCNKSMGTQNMGIFKEYCGFGTSESLYIKADGKKVGEVKVEEIKQPEVCRPNTIEKTIISDFRQQEYIFLQKVSPKLRDVIKQQIIKYDLSHSTLKIIKNNDDFDIIMKKLKEALANREIYLTDLISKYI